MKKVKFKKEFKNINEALEKIPVELKKNDNVFKMTDGNKTIKVRWEGTLEEGNAIALSIEDDKLINEDMSHMKHLMGYKPESVIGTHNGSGRLMENEKFRELLNSTKK